MASVEYKLGSPAFKLHRFDSAVQSWDQLGVLAAYYDARRRLQRG
jgi:hypothetical protein